LEDQGLSETMLRSGWGLAFWRAPPAGPRRATPTSASASRRRWRSRAPGTAVSGASGLSSKALS